MPSIEAPQKVSGNPYLDKIKEFDFNFHKKLIFNTNNLADNIENDYLPLFKFYAKKQFRQSLLVKDDDSDLLSKKILVKPDNTILLKTFDFDNNKDQKIRLGESIIFMLSTNSLFDDYSFVINNEQKCFLELNILIKILNELKIEIKNEGSYDVFVNNLIVLRLQEKILEKLANQLKNNSKIVKIFKSKINLINQDRKKTVLELNDKIKEKTNQKSKLVYKLKLSEKYLLKWKDNNLVRVKNSNSNFLKQIENSIYEIKESIQEENQAHSLMRLALSNEILSLKNKTSELEKLYNISFENIELELGRLKIEAVKQTTKLKNLREDFDYKTKIVTSYREEKQMEENVRRAVKLISNWWLMIKTRAFYYL